MGAGFIVRQFVGGFHTAGRFRLAGHRVGRRRLDGSLRRVLQRGDAVDEFGLGVSQPTDIDYDQLFQGCASVFSGLNLEYRQRKAVDLNR